MTYRDFEQRAAAIAGLRALIDFLEANPEVPIDIYESARVGVHPRGDDMDQIAEVDRIAAALGVCAGPPHPGSPHHTAQREFGPPGSQVIYEAIAIPAETMARHTAAASYYGYVQPEADAAPDAGVATLFPR